MVLFEVKVYHVLDAVRKGHTPTKQDALSWRLGDETPAEPKHTQLIEAVGEQSAKGLLLKQHPEYDERNGNFQFVVRKVY